MDQSGGHEKRLGKLRLDNLGGAPLGGAALELIAMTCLVSLDRHGCDVVAPRDLELSACHQCGIDRRV